MIAAQDLVAKTFTNRISRAMVHGSTPVNLGPDINTPYDEDSPFLLPDSKTLFFASKGHAGLGGYDIFKSVLVNGKWSKPVNMGAPINSAADDIYFSYDTALKEGFFSSSRVGGYGDMDLYSFSFICDNIETAQLVGEVVSNGQKAPRATILLTDMKNHKTYTSTSDTTGKYSIAIKPERTYNLDVRIAGYLPYTTTLSTPHQCDAYNLYQLVNTNFVTDTLYRHTGQKMAVMNAFYDTTIAGSKSAKHDSTLTAFLVSNNDFRSIWEKDTAASVTYTPAQIDSLNPTKVVSTHIDATPIITGAAIPKMPVVYFDFNSSTINKQYFTRLDSLATFIKKNKQYKILIEGNTDTVGTVEYNQRLSLARANSVATYLESKGVAKDKLHIEGNGKHHLAVVGDGSNAMNRRDDIVITKE